MKKLSNKKGFTLMEMLIVVAIIAILVAISIPAFSTSLEDAKRATDEANLRSAKAVYVVKNMKGELNSNKTYYYDMVDGDFKEKTSDVPGTCIGSCTNHSNAWITIDFTAGKVKWTDVNWTSGKGFPSDCETEETITTPEPPAGGEGGGTGT